MDKRILRDDEENMAAIVDHSNTKCIKCGKCETYINSSCRPVWFKHKDKYGNWTRKYICWYCYHDIGKSRTKPGYFIGRKCCICSVDLSSPDMDHGRKYYDGKGNWTREWLCKNCYAKDRQKFPDSQYNIQKVLRNVRIGYLDIGSNTGRSVIDQAVVSKVLGVEDLNIKMDNFNWYIDLEIDVHGKMDVKGSPLYFKIYKEYEYDYYQFYTGRKIDCDTYMCLGYDVNRENIENVWIIPNDKYVIDKLSITTTNSIDGLSKYEEFRIDEKPYDDVYHSIMKFIKDKKYFGVEGIKKWLKGGI